MDGGGNPVSGEKILIVDDEKLVILSLAFVLGKEGYVLNTAENGEEAVKKAREFQPDVMFLDIMMPKKNGYEVCQEIRNNPDLKDLYIIMLSAKGWDIDRTKALEVGANEFISKPFSPLDVVTRVKAIMAKRVLEKNKGSAIRTQEGKI
jgi:two-component system, OmpR family, alkaline phosphatase synthesis response regulator PhoP